MSKNMSKYGAIPTELICRFSELTKREIIVLCYLYAARNGKTGRCDPSRGDISRKVGMAKSHVSPAVKNLQDLGWIFEHVNGNFQLLNPSEKVTDLVTAGVTDLVTVTEMVTVTDLDKKVTESVTKGYQIGNFETDAHIEVRARVLNNEGTTKEQREESMSAFADADIQVIFAYWQVQLKHPNAKLTPERRTAIRSRLRDGYLPAQILRAIDGCKNSPHHQGRNETGTIYDDLTLICRNGSKLEQFISYNSCKENGNGHSKTYFDPGRTIEPSDTNVIALLPQKSRCPPASVSIEESAAWSAFRDVLAKQLSPEIFATWFKPIIFDGLNEREDAFKVRAGAITHDWVIRYYSELIYKTLAAIGLGELTLEWEIDDSEVEDANIAAVLSVNLG